MHGSCQKEKIHIGEDNIVLNLSGEYEILEGFNIEVQ